MSWVFWYYRGYVAVNKWWDARRGNVVLSDPSLAIFYVVVPMLLAASTYRFLLDFWPSYEEMLAKVVTGPGVGYVLWMCVWFLLTHLYMRLCSRFDPQNKD